MPLIVYICVNYGSPSETLAHLEQLRGSTTEPYAAIVVENSPRSYPELDDWVARYPDNHRYLVGDGNVGYLNGLGIGMRRAMQDWPHADWVVLSNVDLILDASQFELYLATHQLDPRTGVVGPRIVSSMSMKDQNPFLMTRPSLSRMRAWRGMYRSYWIGALYQLGSDLWHRHAMRGLDSGRPHHPAANTSAGGREVYAVHGSIFCMSARLLHKVGAVSWPCFLFGEEIWLAEKARNLGMRVVYDPAMRVEHSEHATTASLSSREKMRWHYQSINWLIENHWEKA